MIDNLLFANSAVKSFAKKKDFVFFGEVDDHHDPVKGVTFDLERQDKQAAYGSYNGYDVALLVRSVTFKHPDHKDQEYNWTIAQFKMHVSNLPHIFIDAKRYDDIVYKNIFAKFPKLRSAQTSLHQINANFAKSHAAYTTPDITDGLDAYIKPEVISAMKDRYSHFDLEVNDSHVLVYYNDKPKDQDVLQSMLDFGVWMCEFIENLNVTNY